MGRFSRLKKALALGVLLVVPVVAAGAWAQVGEGVGRIIEVRGEGRVVNPAAGRDLAAVEGVEILLGDRLTTGAEALLKLQLVDGSLVLVGSETTLEMDQFQFDPAGESRQASLKLPLGKIKAKVADLSEFRERRFRIETPTAVIGVRGTLLAVLVSPDLETTVIAYDQPVEVYNPRRPDVVETVEPGTISRVAEDETPTPSRDMTPLEREAVDQILPPVEAPLTPPSRPEGQGPTPPAEEPRLSDEQAEALLSGEVSEEELADESADETVDEPIDGELDEELDEDDEPEPPISPSE